MTLSLSVSAVFSTEEVPRSGEGGQTTQRPRLISMPPGVLGLTHSPGLPWVPRGANEPFQSAGNLHISTTVLGTDHRVSKRTWSWFRMGRGDPQHPVKSTASSTIFKQNKTKLESKIQPSPCEDLIGSLSDT